MKKIVNDFDGRESNYYAVLMAGPTGIEPATSGVTGRRSNRLNYSPVSYEDIYSNSFAGKSQELIW